MTLTWLDWCVIGGYFAINLLIGLWYRKRASGSTAEFFVSGRQASWWLAGTSMVATTFAADTPLAVTGLVASYGIAGNWLWWNLLLSNMLTVFFFARLWRRAGVVTDLEFTELRYGGKPAAFLRGFRALYLALPINCIILGWVNLAMVKIVLMIFPDLAFPALGVLQPKLAALLVVFGIMLLTALISTISGLWGVLVTDLFQFVLKMGMVIVLAYFAVKAVGGLDALQSQLQALDVAKGSHGSVLAFLPDVGSAWMPMIAFCVYLGVTWWATWYPGSEPGGGGFVAQRMLCARDEKHSLLATLWFSVAHYALRPWPWILTALATLVLYPTLADKESGFVKAVVDPQVLPPALAGLMIAAFAAAYMSTVATQLNWGASYLINDFYRRFLARHQSEKHYVRAAKVATLLLMVASSVVTYFQDSIAGAWKFLMAVGAGTGSVLILRWFWWRINAWSEVAAMVTSFVVSLVLQYGFQLDTNDPREFAWTMLVTVGACTLTWLTVTWCTPPEDGSLLVAFYRRARPNPAFWGPIARQAPGVPVEHDGWHNLVDWLAGCAMIYLALFGTGKLIFGQTLTGFALLALAALAGGVVYWDLSRRNWKIVSDAAMLLAALALARSIVAAPLTDDHELVIRSPVDIARMREQLIRFVWGADRLPGAFPAHVSHGVASPIRDPASVERVDALEITMEAGQRTVAYHFIASTNNGHLVVVHQGHACQLDSLGVGDLVRDLTQAGYGVLGMFMPRCRPDDCPGGCTAAHETLFATVRPAMGSPMKFFLEPIVASLNYLERRSNDDAFPRYTAFHMAGLSGGGWTTTVYAALDPRIRLSFPVAGTLPLYLRFGGSVGDVEQTLPEFYQIAGYPDLYVLGSFGAGRRQVQILNRHDDCCFGVAQHRGPVPYEDALRAYERQVQNRLDALGTGAFCLQIDDTAHSHQISSRAARSVILPELDSARALQSAVAAHLQAAPPHGRHKLDWVQPFVDLIP